MGKTPQYPGAYRDKMFSMIRGHRDGGSAAGWFDTWNAHQFVEGAETPTLQFAVSEGGQVCEFVMLEHAHREGESFEDSERRTRHVSRTWHIEEYTFAGWIRTPKLKLKRAQYRYSGNRRIEAYEGALRWNIRIGGELSTTELTALVRGNRDEWDQLVMDVEKASGSFAEIRELLPADLQEQLAGPRQAVDLSRAEARRLGALGQHLSEVEAPTGEINAVLEETREQLEALRRNVLAAVVVLARIQLQLPEARPNWRIEQGTHDLAGLAEVSEILSGK